MHGLDGPPVAGSQRTNMVCTQTRLCCRKTGRTLSPILITQGCPTKWPAIAQIGLMGQMTDQLQLSKHRSAPLRSQETHSCEYSWSGSWRLAIGTVSPAAHGVQSVLPSGPCLRAL